MGNSEREAGRENTEALLAHVEFYRDFVDRGDMSKAVYVVEWCLNFGLPIPDWLEIHVRAAMQLYYEKGGAAKQGSKGNRARSKKARIDAVRYNAVERERARPGATKPDAIKAASQTLRGTFAQGSEGQIEASYDKIAPIYREQTRKPGPKPK